MKSRSWEKVTYQTGFGIVDKCCLARFIDVAENTEVCEAQLSEVARTVCHISITTHTHTQKENFKL